MHLLTVAVRAVGVVAVAKEASEGVGRGVVRVDADDGGRREFNDLCLAVGRGGEAAGACVAERILSVAFALCRLCFQRLRLLRLQRRNLFADVLARVKPANHRAEQNRNHGKDDQRRNSNALPFAPFGRARSTILCRVGRISFIPVVVLIHMVSLLS
ncbi:hypothetical protein SDC9_204393 [bioreactor metagenome]|uniref:Uncharacterized protein n=1 Tax=bioreactor metagenome TaxID=1076179 RepID=A0A645J0T1_9ZZZZ